MLIYQRGSEGMTVAIVLILMKELAAKENNRHLLWQINVGHITTKQNWLENVAFYHPFIIQDETILPMSF